MNGSATKLLQFMANPNACSSSRSISVGIAGNAHNANNCSKICCVSTGRARQAISSEVWS